MEKLLPGIVQTVVCTYIHEMMGYNQKIDYICTNCYKIHATILNIVEPHDMRQVAKKSLKHIIESMSLRLNQDNGEDHLTSCITQIILYVAQSLEQDCALLLPEVSKIFLNMYGYNLHDASINDMVYEIEMQEGSVYTV